MPDMTNAQAAPTAPLLKRAERPNTVAGLVEKCRELKALRDELDAQLRRFICDIDHLDAGAGPRRSVPMSELCVAALARKRAELAAEIEAGEARLHELRANLTHVDATIRLFAPHYPIAAITAKKPHPERPVLFCSPRASSAARSSTSCARPQSR